MGLRYLYLASLLLSAVVGFVYRNHIKSRQLLVFIPFLSLLFIQELSLYIYVQQNPKAPTGIVYNFFIPISTLFMAVFYYRIPFITPFRKTIIWMTVIYFVIVIFTFSFLQSINIYNSYLTLVAGAIITCFGIFFLINYFNLDNSTKEKHWLPVIWITIGVVTFYPITNISFAFYKHLLAYRAEILGLKLYQVIPELMSIFMYSCFTYAFYLCKKKN